MATLFYNENFSRRENLLLNFANYFGQVAINLIKKKIHDQEENCFNFQFSMLSRCEAKNSRPRSTPYKRGLIDW